LPFYWIFFKFFQVKLEEQNVKFNSFSAENNSVVEQLTKKIEGYEGYFLDLFFNLKISLFFIDPVVYNITHFVLGLVEKYKTDKKNSKEKCEKLESIIEGENDVILTSLVFLNLINFFKINRRKQRE